MSERTQCPRHPNIWKYPWEVCDWCKEWQKEKKEEKDKKEEKEDTGCGQEYPDEPKTTWKEEDLQHVLDHLSRHLRSFTTINSKGRLKYKHMVEYLYNNTTNMTTITGDMVTTWQGTKYSELLDILLGDIRTAHPTYREHLEDIVKNIHNSTE